MFKIKKFKIKNIHRTKVFKSKIVQIQKCSNLKMFKSKNVEKYWIWTYSNLNNFRFEDFCIINFTYNIIFETEKFK
jgi:hypothetical protein